MAGRSKRTRSSRAVEQDAKERQDGAATRERLLQAAGEVFSEFGYAEATSKEICERAGSNLAAVNYHFGSKDQLYAQVLEEAHRRLVNLEEITAAAQSARDPRARLKALLRVLVKEMAVAQSTSSWEMRVLIREVLSSAALVDRMVRTQVLPKSRFLKETVAQIMQLPVEHPAVSRCLVSVVGPSMFLLLIGQSVHKKVLPHLDMEPEALASHMTTFALAGIDAIAAEVRQRKRSGE